MVSELQKAVESDLVFFGTRETLKHITKVSKVFLASDARAETHRLFREKHAKVEVLDMPKSELAIKFGLAFDAEVYGVRK